MKESTGIKSGQMGVYRYMKLWISESDRIKKQAGDEMIILLQGWKGRIKRYRIYRYCLCVALILCCAALGGLGYYYVDSSIPSVLHVRAGQEQSFNLGIPAKADIVSVSEQ